MPRIYDMHPRQTRHSPLFASPANFLRKPRHHLPSPFAVLSAPSARCSSSIASNTALFSLLGTSFGGDGRTTFALPDLRDAAPNGLTYLICTQGIFPSRL